MERHKKAVIGRIDKVPCPWCGQTNDFRELGGFAGEDGVMIGLEDGAISDCDHCKHPSVVVKIERLPHVILRQKHT
jgi:hypothetical protein